MDRQRKEHWWQRVEISSEEECNQVTGKLAAELLRENTPEQLAVIAAQHLIYVDVLKHCKPEAPGFGFRPAEKRSIQITEEELREILASYMLKAVKLALKARVKHSSRTANDARHRTNRARKEEAMAKWDAWEERNPKGEKVRTRFAKQHCSAYGVTDTVMCRWIREHEEEKTSSSR